MSKNHSINSIIEITYESGAVVRFPAVPNTIEVIRRYDGEIQEINWTIPKDQKKSLFLKVAGIVAITTTPPKAEIV